MNSPPYCMQGLNLKLNKTVNTPQQPTQSLLIYEKKKSTINSLALLEYGLRLT